MNRYETPQTNQLGYEASYDCGQIDVHIADKDSVLETIDRAEDGSLYHAVLRDDDFCMEMYSEMDKSDQHYRTGLLVDNPGNLNYSRHKDQLTMIAARPLGARLITSQENNTKIYVNGDTLIVQKDDTHDIHIALHVSTDKVIVITATDTDHDDTDALYRQIELSSICSATIASNLMDLSQVKRRADVHIGIPKSLSTMADVELSVQSILGRLYSSDTAPQLTWSSDIDSRWLSKIGYDPALTDQIASRIVSSCRKKGVIEQYDVVQAIRESLEPHHQ